jgi:hypothetical protein
MKCQVDSAGNHRSGWGLPRSKTGVGIRLAADMFVPTVYLGSWSRNNKREMQELAIDVPEGAGRGERRSMMMGGPI